MLPEIKRFADRLLHPRHDSKPAATTAGRSAASVGPHYHCGDHWQNLLASPMDARHYVLEDWGQDALSLNASDALYGEPLSWAETHSMRRRQA